MEISLEKRLELVDQIRQLQIPSHVASYPHIAVCGPSGCGKSTLIRSDPNSIIKTYPNVFDFSISACTRKLRENEVDGVDYYQKSIADFGMENFFETNEYAGNKKLYGTPVSEIERIAIYMRKRIVFDIDPNGAKKIQEAFKEDVFTVFLNTTDPFLRERFEKRSSITKETPEDIGKRIIAAGIERRMVTSGDFKPDLVIPYDMIRVEEAVNQILFEAKQKRAQYVSH